MLVCQRCGRFCITGCKRTKGALVACDNCNTWFHCQCVNLLVESAKKKVSHQCKQCLDLGLTTAFRPHRRDLQAGANDGSASSQQPEAVVQRPPRYSRSSRSSRVAASSGASSASAATAHPTRGSPPPPPPPPDGAPPPPPPPLPPRPKTESLESDDGPPSDEDTPQLESAAERVKVKGTMFPNEKYLVAPREEQSLTNKGGQGEIILVYDGGAAKFAAKFPRPKARAAGRNTAHDQLMREIELWAQLADHPNVASLVDVHCEFGSPYLVLPYADLGNLVEHIQRRQQPDAQADVVIGPAWAAEPLDWMIQLAFGLLYLHDSCVVHGDIKPQNVLVYSTDVPQFPEIKVCSVGPSASPTRTHHPAHSPCVTGVVADGSPTPRAPRADLRPRS